LDKLGDAARHWQELRRDHRIGQLVFAVTRLIQKYAFLRRGVWRMVSKEQRQHSGLRRMSTVQWDTFTGSAPCKSVLLRTLHPAFMARFLKEIVAGIRQTRAALRSAHEVDFSRKGIWRR